MEFIDKNSELPKNCALILGFFDGIHAGHRDVINNTPNNHKILITFSNSPAEYFNENFNYIYNREHNYKILKEYGIDYIFEQDFSQIVNMKAEAYLEMLIAKFKPISITTGFNHTFGANREGDANFLKCYKSSFNYYCTPPTIIDNEIVSSTKIKEFLRIGNLEKANKFLTRNFSIESTVIEGLKLGRKIGFPTANMKYPQNIIKIPYGVYKVQVFNQPAILNWGIKPTIGSDEILEIHIPNFKKDLYGEKLKVDFLSKIRNEKKFESLDELKLQIERDIEECLK